jgi:hypothetical protein
MSGFIERDQWESFLEEFGQRNHSRATRLEVVGEVGAQEEERYLPLIGLSLEPKGTEAGSVEIILGGETARDPRHVEHLVENVQRVAPFIGPDGLEEGVSFEDAEGAKTILLFEKLSQIPEKTSDIRHADSKGAQR